MNIYLIGMPGVGKTTIGEQLAKLLKYNFIDTDDLMKQKCDIPFNELLKKEKKFRVVESEIINNIKSVKNTVVSLGGGSILNKQNIDNLYGIIIYLKLDIDLLRNRVDVSTRPLLQKNDIKKVFESRKKLYEEYSDYVIENNNIDETLNEIKEYVSKPKKKVIIVNGPNLNMLGKRDVNHYGTKTLDEINDLIYSYDIFDYEFYQSNVEGEIINKIQKIEKFDAIVINPAAYTHTSVAIRDALETVDIPKIEVHLSDINNREKFRKINFITEVCDKKFVGKCEYSYLDAINYLKKIKI